MEEPTSNIHHLGATSRRIAQRLLTIGENRLELLTVEVQEERERLLHTLLMALSVATFGLLAMFTLTAAIVLVWAQSPVTMLLILTVLYGGTGAYLGWRLNARLRHWQAFSASLDQLRKDRACLEDLLE